MIPLKKYFIFSILLYMQNYVLIVGILYIIFSFFEFQFPVESGQGISGRIQNIVHGITLIVVGGFITIQVYSAFHIIIPDEPRNLGNNTMWFSLWITFLYLLLTDLIFYWYHRLQHISDTFWQVHELHHTDRTLNVTSSLRSYWIEKPLQTLLITIPVFYIIGIDNLAVILFPIISLIWLLFAHANIKLSLGFLTPIICGPQVHRIHHSLHPKHHNKNFAQYFPFIDKIFGTYYAPKNHEWVVTGIKHNSGNDSVLVTFLKPWKIWAGMLYKKIVISSRNLF